MQQQQKNNTHKTQRALCTLSDDLLCSVHGNVIQKSILITKIQ